MRQGLVTPELVATYRPPERQYFSVTSTRSNKLQNRLRAYNCHHIAHFSLGGQAENLSNLTTTKTIKCGREAGRKESRVADGSERGYEEISVEARR